MPTISSSNSIRNSNGTTVNIAAATTTTTEAVTIFADIILLLILESDRVLRVKMKWMPLFRITVTVDCIEEEEEETVAM
jgi:hypothetical protein